MKLDLKNIIRQNAVVSVLKDTEVVIPMESMVDIRVEKDRIMKEIDQLESDIDRLESRLTDSSFLGKAPAQVISKEKERLLERKDRLERLRQRIMKFD